MKGRMGNFFSSKKFILPLVILWAVSLAAVILLLLPGNRLSSGFKQVLPVAVQNAQPSGHGPYSYIVPMGTKLLTQNDTFQSPTQLYEDERALGPGNSQHADIGSKGMGRFSFWKGGSLIFSSSDNSDPRTNGRQYTLILSFRKFLFTLGLGILFTITLIFAFLFRRYLKSPRTLFYISLLIVTIAFLIPRLPWFVDFPLPIIQRDTASYFEPVRQMFYGHLPVFSFRTPGYPLFLAAAFLISPRLMFVIVIQNLLTLGSVLFFLWVVYKTYGRLVIGAALVMVAHVTQPLLSAHDFILITESLFTSLLLFCIGFFFLGIHTRQPRFFFMFSALGGYAILVRPAGIFLLGLLLVTLLYLVVNRYSIKSVLCLALPMPVMIIMLLSYNYIITGEFVLSNVSDLTLYGITATYWEPDAAFPEAVNAGIQKFHAEIPEGDRQILYTSWDYVKLTPLFVNATEDSIFIYQYGVFGVTPELNRNEQMALAKRIAWKAILSHPEMSFKFFWANLSTFLIDSSSWYAYLYNDITWVANQMYIEGTATDKFIGREYAELPTIPNLRLEGVGENRQFVVVPSLLSRGYLDVAGLLGRVFDNKAWLVAYFIVLLSSMFITVRSKFRHRGAFLLLAMSSLHFAAGVVVALTTSMSNRYPSPTRFIEVLAVVFIPLFFLADDKESADTAGKLRVGKNSERVDKNKRGPRNPALEHIAHPAQAERAMSRNSESLQGKNNYYEWNLGVFPIERGRRIMDFGCGPGLYFESIMKYAPELYMATDYSANYLKQVEVLGDGYANCKTCLLDLMSTSLPKRLVKQQFDYAFCFDVLEHIQDDEKALQNIHRIMTSNGTGLLFLRVPALQFIYGTNDEAIGHFRRYSADSLTALLRRCLFRIQKMRYHNMLGIIPWYVIGRVAGRSLALSSNEGRLFNSIVPLLRFAESIISPPIGLSLYCICSPA